MQSYSDDTKRRSKILLIILFGFLCLSLSSLVAWIYNYVTHGSVSLSIYVLVVINLVVGLLVIVVRLGYPMIAGWIFIGLLLLALLPRSLTYGLLPPQYVATYAFIIICSGIVIGHQQMVIITFGVIGYFVTLVIMDVWGIRQINEPWLNDQFGVLDYIVMLITYSVIALVSWLSSREISKSFARARISEKQTKRLAEKLRTQRDHLEVMVEKRTRQLRQSQLQQLLQVNRFAEFGQLSAGLMHDIKNPLSVISITIDTVLDQLKASDARSEFNSLSKMVDQAKKASRNVDRMIASSRKHILTELDHETFDVLDEVRDVIEMVSHRADRLGIMIRFNIQESKPVLVDSYPTKFFQSVSNVLTNAIDVLEDTDRENREIVVECAREELGVLVSVTDNGPGISPKLITKIFKPLFTTKKNNSQKGTGLGLFMTRQFIEYDMFGSVDVHSEVGKGTCIEIRVPYQIISHELNYGE